MKSSRLFIKNVFIFLIPVLVPVIILGTLSIVITRHYVYENIKQNNNNILKQEKVNIELVFNEVDSLYVNFSTNPEIAVELKSILKTPILNRAEYESIKTISNFIDAQANAKRYIHSIYVYFENDFGRLITTSEGVISNFDFYDMEWMKQFKNVDFEKKLWLESRVIKPYAFDSNGKRVITVYRGINSYMGDKRVGMIVLNIDANYIESIMNKLDTVEEQCLIVVDENYNLLLKNKEISYVEALNIEKIIKSSENYMTYELNGEKYVISKLESDLYGLDFLSVVPEKKLYMVPNLLTKVVAILLVVLVIYGVTFTYFFMKKRFRKLRNIVEILDYMDEGKNVSHYLQEQKDEYSYITNKIIEANILQKYISVQLSERKYKRKTLELLALNAQINPHFLYNTLETIYWKSFEFTEKANVVSYMIEDLSDILKFSLHSDSEMVSIKEEIDNTKSYIKLQKIRYREKFQVVWEYEDELLKCKTNKLVLQPLIENSIYHGIKENGEVCEIIISITKDDDLVTFCVKDNGIGIHENKLMEIRDKLVMENTPIGHIGLCNTNKRLVLLHGDIAKLSIESTYKVGTKIYFRIPIN